MGQLHIRSVDADELYETSQPVTRRKDKIEVAANKVSVQYVLGQGEWSRIETRGKWTSERKVKAPAGGQTLAGALELLLDSQVPFRMSSPGVILTGKAQGKVSPEFGVTLYGAREVRVHAATGQELAVAIAFGLEDAKIPPLTRAEAAAGEFNPDNQEGMDPTDPDLSEV